MGWHFGGAPAPFVAGAPALTGLRSLTIGRHAPPNGSGTSASWQAFDVPPWARTVDVSTWTWQRSTGPGGRDAQMALLVDEDPALVPPWEDPAGIVFREVVNAASWRRWSLATDVRRFGVSQMWVVLAVANDGLGGRAWMHVDEVSVSFCP
jgi:hypothetical protein